MLVGDHVLDAVDTDDMERVRPSSIDPAARCGAVAAATLTDRSTREERGTGGGRTHMLLSEAVVAWMSGTVDRGRGLLSFRRTGDEERGRRGVLRRTWSFGLNRPAVAPQE
jgi:hypothetical protein